MAVSEASFTSFDAWFDIARHHSGATLISYGHWVMQSDYKAC